ncbi:hypothetical protein HYX13_04620, partial [Candidatus Woesearchaeota archaeon]|nr:hypothetical protein [Candidatus Woesearchaeota archaeon]
MEKKSIQKREQWDAQRFQIERELFALQQNERKRLRKKNKRPLEIPARTENTQPREDDTFSSLEKGHRFLPIFGIFVCLLLVAGV